MVISHNLLVNTQDHLQQIPLSPPKKNANSILRNKERTKAETTSVLIIVDYLHLNMVILQIVLLTLIALLGFKQKPLLK